MKRKNYGIARLTSMAAFLAVMSTPACGGGMDEITISGFEEPTTKPTKVQLKVDGVVVSEADYAPSFTLKLPELPDSLLKYDAASLDYTNGKATINNPKAKISTKYSLFGSNIKISGFSYGVKDEIDACLFYTNADVNVIGAVKDIECDINFKKGWNWLYIVADDKKGFIFTTSKPDRPLVWKVK